MDPERWRRVEDVFHRAVSLPRVERDALIAKECGDDDALRAEVMKLITADDSPNALVDQFDSGALRPREDPLIGREIGRYRLIARLGAGGMGLVYRAERTDGLFKHEVAIKLIRIELATESLVRRFELERRTLAGLHHPNIAQLHDGGTLPDGRPYLVMELVRGIPIDRYCDEHELTIEDRLQLFVQVCRGVHFAHQNLIVHRDLKPGNILVDEAGVPKLLDFGIARMLDESTAEDGTSFTLTGAYLLTPDYASPEQLTLGPVTTSMDVYSLGVLLYEILTGKRPFRSENKSPVEWHRDVLERTPTRPSTAAVSTVAASNAVAPDPSANLTSEALAARRATTPKGLQRKLRGDLDRIVLMALRKEPERRYASVKDLADDIERHFTGHPVVARGDTFGYRASKFIQRNRLAVASAFAVLVALVAGIVLARRGEQHAQEQALLAMQSESRAQAEAENARRSEQHAQEQALHARVEAQSFQGIAQYLMDSFLTSTTAIDAQQLAQKRQRIQLHAAQVRREYAEQDHLRANLLDSLGQVAQRLGLFDDANALVQEALAIRSKAFGERSLEYALSLRSFGLLRYAQGDLAQAADLLSQALVLHREHDKETHTDVASLANDLAACLRGLGRLDEAEALHNEALALRRKDADGSLAVAESLNNLAGVDLDRTDLKQAALHLEEALSIRRRILGVEDSLTLQSMSNLATTVWRMGDRDRALALLEEAEKGCRALQADGEDDLSHALSNHAAMLLQAGRAKEAEPLLAEAVDLQVRRLGPTHPSVASTITKQAQLQQALHHMADARASWERVMVIRREPGASPRYLGQSLYEYGVFLWETKARDEAREAWREAVDVLHAIGGAKTPLLGRVEVAYGQALMAAGDMTQARALLEDAVTILSAPPGEQNPDLAEARKALAKCLAAIEDKQ